MRWLGGWAVWRENYSYFPSGAYGAAAPAMLNYFDPAPAPAKGAPLSAEAQAELNTRYADQLAAKVAEAEKDRMEKEAHDE